MLGFSLLLGILATMLAVVPRALRQPAPINWTLFIGGVLAWMFMPPILTGIAALLLGIIVPPAIAWFVLSSRIVKLDQERNEERERAEQVRQARADQRAAAKAEAEAWPSLQKGWANISRGRLMHIAGQPLCFVMISDNRLLLRFVQYTVGDAFLTGEDFFLNVKSVLSMNVACPTITKTRSKTVPVTSVETKRRSPVKRGLVGGVLLGPAGLVLGAASGLNSQVTSTVSHETVKEEYETTGDPQLIIGTRDIDRPVIKIKFDPSSIADEWMFRIRGAQG